MNSLKLKRNGKLSLSLRKKQFYARLVSFSIEIPKEVVKEVKQMVKPSKPALQEESRKQVPQPPEVKKKVIPTVIEAQEKQWKTSENYGLNLDTKSVVNGIVWSEVLGPPRAKKKYNFR